MEAVCSILTGVSQVIKIDQVKDTYSTFTRNQKFENSSFISHAHCLIKEIQVIKSCFFESACCLNMEKILDSQNAMNEIPVEAKIKLSFSGENSEGTSLNEE